MNYYDLIGAILSLICTYLFVKADKRAWIISAFAIPFDAYVYYSSQLYGDMFLQGFYFFSFFYGWYRWCYGGGLSNELPVSCLSINQILFQGLLVVLAIVLLKPLLLPFNPSMIATMDATTTVLSLFGQWLLCQKKIETWFVWFTVDTLYIYLYGFKALPFHSVMACIYLLMAIAGFRSWYQQLPSRPLLKLS